MEIHWRKPNHLPIDHQLAVEERLQRLTVGHTDLIDLWIDVEKSGHHRQGQDRVRLRCMVRDAEILAEASGDGVEEALQAALEAFEREVRERRERLEDRPRQRPPEPPFLGVVDRLHADQGYGFVVTEDGQQVYFHRNAVRDGLRFDSLEVGQRVGLNVEAGAKGPQATVVTPPPPGTPE